MAILIKDDITDLPVYEGSQKLLRALSPLLNKHVQPNYSFENLEEVKCFLELKEELQG